MSVLNKDQILNFDDLAIEKVKIPEWGDGEVIVRCLTGQERDELESFVVIEKPDGARGVDLTNFRARLISLSVIDEKGDRLFSVGDIERLTKKSAKALDRIFDVAERLSALRNKDEEKAIKNL